MTTSTRRRKRRGRRRSRGVGYLLLKAFLDHRKAKAREKKALSRPPRRAPKPKSQQGGGGKGSAGDGGGFKPEPRYYAPDRKPFAPHGGWRPQEPPEEFEPDIEQDIDDDEIEIPEDEVDGTEFGDDEDVTEVDVDAGEDAA